MQTAVAASIDFSHPLPVAHPPLPNLRRGAERPPATEPWTAALAGLRIEYLQSAGADLARLRKWLDRLAADPANLEALAGTLRGFHSFAASGVTYGFPRVSEIGRAGEAACASLVAGRALPEAYRLAALGALLDSLDAWFAAAVAIATLGEPSPPPPPPAAPVIAWRARRSGGDPSSPHPAPPRRTPPSRAAASWWSRTIRRRPSPSA
ncbi:MAG TPA: hypothetical protein VHB47_05225 [Thermoanaerobaculia bacterium]|jgi:hypothetical protein|nr:hypothetical protein [Thermoanaerobaculia bacterium]